MYKHFLPLKYLAYIISVLAFTLCFACSKSDSSNLAQNPDYPKESNRNFKVVHTYVALCDNASQGIQPVPTKIGNGDDPNNNLYWGCSDGARSYFSKSKLWKRISIGKVKNQPNILERIVFQHKKTRCVLVLDAWKGSKIQPCLQEFIQSAAGQHYESLQVKDSKGEHRINLGGGADFLCYIGHNGLMEFSIPALPSNPKRTGSSDIAVLCCKSNRFFKKHLGDGKPKPAVMTASNMYPGAFILHDVLEGWLKKETQTQLRYRAAKAYAKNQKISTKSALNVFAKLP